MLNRNVEGKIEREHPHSYFYGLGLVETIKCPYDMQNPDIKLDVNTADEYEYVRKIYSRFEGNDFHAREYIREI